MSVLDQSKRTIFFIFGYLQSPDEVNVVYMKVYMKGSIFMK